MNRIIVERDANGLWAAWFDEQPDDSQVGRSQGEAVRRLLFRTRSQRAPARDIVIDSAACREGHLEFVVVTQAEKTSCPDCQGTGQYVGLSVIEDCRTCAGTGEV